MLGLQKNYKTYIKCPTDYLANSMPNNLLKFSFKVKANSVAITEENGVWGSWCEDFTQYFPIATVFWLVSTWVLWIVLREVSSSGMSSMINFDIRIKLLCQIPNMNK